MCGKSLIDRVLERVAKTRMVDQFILAVPETTENDVFKEVAERHAFTLFRGSEHDVLDRYYQAAKRYAADDDAIIRVCADNPFVAPEEIDRLVNFFRQNIFDYAFNHVPAANNQYPDGLGAEMFSFSVLKKLWNIATDVKHREHVSLSIWENLPDYCVGILRAPESIACSGIKLDVDTQEDFDWTEKIYQALIREAGDRIFTAQEIVSCAKVLKSNCKSC